jgi:hypothetical protein
MTLKRMLVAAAVVCVGCGSTGTEVPLDAGADAGSDGGTDAGADAGWFTISGLVIENGDGGPIANARVCLVEEPSLPCGVSGGDGRYTLAVPRWHDATEVAFNITAEGHLGFTDLVREPGSDSPFGGVIWPSQVALLDDTSAVRLFFGSAGMVYPAQQTGFVLASVFRSAGGGMAGQTVSITPAAGAGPVYLDPAGKPDPALQGVTSNGYLLFGAVPAGPVEITTAGAACDPVAVSTGMWKSARSGSVAGVVVAGSMTEFGIICPSH